MAETYISTHKAILATLAAGLSLLSPTAIQGGSLNACDLNGDGAVNILDVQLAANMALGLVPCTADIAGAGVCDTLVIQRVVNAVISGSCIASISHNVTLTWTASTSLNVTGYNVYRGTQSGGPFTKLTPAPVAGTSYIDFAVQAGHTYYYVATAVDNNNNESAYSDPASALVPTP